MPSTESALTESIRKALKAEGAYVNKNVGGPNSRGRPDLEGCYRGHHFGLEVKLPGKEKTLTRLQSSQLTRIRRAGGIGLLITSKEKALDVFRYIDRRIDGG